MQNREIIEPHIDLHGWQTVRAYAQSKGYSNTQYVYELIKSDKLDSLRVKELNNLLLVKEKK